jgi:hypothetical protein
MPLSNHEVKWDFMYITNNLDGDAVAPDCFDYDVDGDGMSNYREYSNGYYGCIIGAHKSEAGHVAGLEPIIGANPHVQGFKQTSDSAWQDPIERNNRYAILIGVNKNNFGLHLLKYPDEDVYDWESIFINEYSFKPENIITLENSVVDKNCNRTNIENAITTTITKANQNDLIFFFFSGHGGPWGSGKWDVLIYSLDVVIKDVEFAEMWKDFKGRLVVFFDACHSGGMDEFVKNPYYSSQRLIITACGTNEGCNENDILQNGEWTYCWVHKTITSAQKHQPLNYLFNIAHTEYTKINTSGANPQYYQGAITKTFTFM